MSTKIGKRLLSVGAVSSNISNNSYSSDNIQNSNSNEDVDSDVPNTIDDSTNTVPGQAQSNLFQGNVMNPSVQQTTRKPQQTLYKPSIYSYTCRGAYFAYSDYRGSAGNESTSNNASANINSDSKNKTTANNNIKGINEGMCHGFRTRLELLQDMEPDTRIGALKRFTSLADYDDYDDNVYLEDDNETSNGSGRSSGDSTGNIRKGVDGQQATKSISVSPALIFQNADVSSMIEANGMSDNQTIENDDGLLPEEELIRRQQWKCYGTTKVDYLILKNVQTGHQKIAAVVPRNTGLSVRIIEAINGSTHQERNRPSLKVINKIASISLFWINFLITFDYTEEDTDSPLTTPTDKSNDDEKDEVTGKQESSQTVTVREGLLARPSPLQIELIKKSIQLTANFSLKVWEQVKYNVSWIYFNLQDDFASRTYEAGHKIVSNIPKTVYGTSAFISKMYTYVIKRMLDDDNDNDDDDDDHKPNDSQNDGDQR